MIRKITHLVQCERVPEHLHCLVRGSEWEIASEDHPDGGNGVPHADELD
jgi:hypothetical protein